MLANFVEGHQITISAESFLILTTGFKVEDVSSLLHRYIREIGYMYSPWWPCFADQIHFSYISQRASCNHFYQIILNSDYRFQRSFKV